jgi:type IV pilus assembly protein PilY1
MVYVGANDGMLHGFDAETGSEKVAYVPASVYSNELDQGLHYFADVDYQHRFYADLSPTYADAGVNGVWKSVIVGGNRAGGRSVFALDVTDPSAFLNNNNSAESTVMWEFTHPDMGGSYSRPQIAQMNNGRWAAIFGNGYNRNDNDGHDGEAKLFVVYLDADPTTNGWVEGIDYQVFTTKIGTNTNNLTRNGLSTPRLYDLDGDSTVDRIFAGDIQGNMWVWNVEGVTASSWATAYGSPNSPQPLFSGVDNAQITTQPIILFNSDVDDDNNEATKNLVVLFGTGQFITGGDKTTTDTQYFMGVYDNGTFGSAGNIVRADLTPRSIGTQTDGDGEDAKRNIAVGDKVNWAATDGWVLTLPDLRERVITTPFVRRNVVFFNTSIPDNIPCTGGGSGWQMAVEALDGLDPTASAFDSNGDGVVTSDDPIYSGKVFLNGLPSDTATLGDKAYTPGSDGALPKPETLRSLGGATTRLSWGEIFRSE